MLHSNCYKHYSTSYRIKQIVIAYIEVIAIRYLELGPTSSGSRLEYEMSERPFVPFLQICVPLSSFYECRAGLRKVRLYGTAVR